MAQSNCPPPKSAIASRARELISVFPGVTISLAEEGILADCEVVLKRSPIKLSRIDQTMEFGHVGVPYTDLSRVLEGASRRDAKAPSGWLRIEAEFGMSDQTAQRLVAPPTPRKCRPRSPPASAADCQEIQSLSRMVSPPQS
jgi:hypothetical protein